MKPFSFEDWHCWQSNDNILLSDEKTKTLHSFKSTDDAINWLFLSGKKPVARALNSHIKTS